MEIIIIMCNCDAVVGREIAARLSRLSELSVGGMSQPKITSGLLCIEGASMLKIVPYPIEEKIIDFYLEKEKFPPICKVSKLPNGGNSMFKNMKRRFRDKRRA